MLCLQELCGRRKQSSASSTSADSAELVNELPSILSCKAQKESLPSACSEQGGSKQESSVSSAKIMEIQNKLIKLLQAQQTDPSTVSGYSTAKRRLIECTKSGLKLVEVSKSLLEGKMKTNLISRDSCDQVSLNCTMYSVARALPRTRNALVHTLMGFIM